MKKYKSLLVLIFLGMFLLLPGNILSQKQMEHLNRGLVAIREGDGYFLKWRLLGNEPYNTKFNIYRAGERINEEPVGDVTSFLDATAPLNSVYRVRAVIDEREMVGSRSARIINNREGTAGYFDIPLNRPPTGVRGGNYTPNDASVADLTGDGEYEIILKWDPSNSKDNSQDGHTDNVLLDAYTMDGAFMWRIDLGQNIRAGAHYTQFLVYDFDGNGRAEIMVKTAPGTKDGLGNYISKGPAINAQHQIDYSNDWGWILSGPEYITVFDGLTGEELATDNYWPLRGSVAAWGDNYGNRVDRFNAAVAYVDGERPSGVFQRGYYSRMTFAAWDWRNGRLTRKWTFDSNTTGNSAYFGQGNHSIHIIDANGDGRHDIVTGAATIASDGTGMHTTGRGHGDATHVTYMIKDDPRPLIFMPYESGGHGVSLRYADDGELVFNHRQAGDIGRGVGAEIDPQRPGFHFWASGGLGLYDIRGVKVGNVPNSINHVIWWDGELSRELLNSNRIDRWSIANNTSTRLLTANGASSINGTKANPVLQADLFGDWREEVIFRRDDNVALRVYTTAIPTTHKLYTFMHDPIYRVAISWQNSSYNQPPHPGFYVATDMDFPPPTPDIALVSGVNRGSGRVIKNLIVQDIPNAEIWELMDDLSENDAIYGDLNFYVNPLPEFLAGAEWIRTANASRRLSTRDVIAKFEVEHDAIVHVLHTQRVSNKPNWLSEYDKAGEVAVVNISGASTLMDLYSKEVQAGESVYLGINSIDGAANAFMYMVAVESDVSSDISYIESERASLSIYPNPFNNSATIEFKQEVQAPVRLELYDINGRLVRVMMRDSYFSGSHTITFERDGLAAGVYILQLVSGNQMFQEKIVIVN
ncbi:rhamnogalacturonan lyase family protein [Natronoflexus pectinivorans]|uniref:Rhamnogalacturonan endolyase n=1 Tax=Natronoflexus pectinivorans TaxID=682526 RepID=A0A4R2GHD4_9BACT|nr:T9SS type A sorting domain-containing protein [Natronoflexus pectinivorans]TCO07747.1 rhamnogalacturonan endolyase [Natronoflexus pectinivorans]